MTAVQIRPALFRWAREQADLSVKEVADRYARYAEWEQGTHPPTLKQLEDFAGFVNVPLGQLFLDEPPTITLPMPDFRTVGNARVRKVSPNLLDTVHTMQRRQAWMRDFLTEAGAEALTFVGSMSTRRTIKQVATHIRGVLKLRMGWASQHPTVDSARKALREMVEKAGILIVYNGIVENNTHRLLDPEEFRGFVLVDDLAPAIFVNAADSMAAQMFTVAHELAHIWIGKSGIFNLPKLLAGDNAEERFCNRVAAELLIPEEELRSKWRAYSANVGHVEFFAREFKVSPIAAGLRAKELELITEDEYVAFYNAYTQRLRALKALKRKSGGNFYDNQTYRVGPRFMRNVAAAAREGRILYRDAYALTGLRGKTFDRYLTEVTAEQ